MLDGLFLAKLKDELNILLGARIQKINQIGKTEFLFILHKDKKYKLLISLDRNYYRINLTEKEYETPVEPTMFTMLLRKHFEGGILHQIEQFETDRIITLTILKQTELYDKKYKKMIIELMGKNSNLIIAENNDEIIDAYKKIGVSETGNTILPHAIYSWPKDKKVNILKDDYHGIVDTKDDILNNIYGISPKYATYIINQDNPKDYLNKIKNLPIRPSSFIYNDKQEFYFTPLNQEYKEYKTLSSLLEEFYFRKTYQDIKKETSNNLDIIVNNQIKKLKNKINNLEDDLNTANNNLKYQHLGTLIINNLYQIKGERLDNITLYDYEEEKDINISLDKTKTVKDNAKNFFTKANKAKKSIEPISNQINIAKDEIEYLELIKFQIQDANIKDILEIKEELIEKHYIKDTTKGKKHKKQKPNLLSYDLDGIKVYVGKNNLQNDYLTNHLANNNDYWFHVAYGPGSHVVIMKSEALTEKEIRFCANLAAYHSYYKDSSSVPVIYTRIRDLRKIPGKKNCFVQYKNEHLIYIDPEKK